MMILNLEQSKEPGVVEIRASMEDAEFEQLLGNLDGLMVFAAKTVTEPASVVQTGARHSYAKYLLFPVKLRRQFKTDEYDFENLRCGALKNKNKLYVVYEVARTGFAQVRSSMGKSMKENPISSGEMDDALERVREAIGTSH